MDVRNPLSGEQPVKPGNGRAARRLPLAIVDPQPVTALRPAWRSAAQAATVGIFIILFFIALSLARPIVLPVTAAFVVTMLLAPLAESADRARVPALVSALVLWLLVVAAFYMITALVSAPVVDWINKAPDIGRGIQQKLQLLEAPLAALRDMRNAVLPADAGKGITVDVVAIAQQAVSVVTPALGQILIFFVALFFMLLGRRRLRPALVAFFHEREARLRMLRIVSDIEHNLTGYLGVVALINAGVGIGAGVIAALVGLPDPVAWGVLAFVLNFIPYIGPAIMELGMFLVGLVSFPSLPHALIAPLLYIGMALIEGQFITPSIVGRRFTLNPLTVFLSLVFWAWLWGPVGAFLAVPILIMGLVAAAHLFPKHEPELPD
jgi:predicted PurR-regulated permease PerM